MIKEIWEKIEVEVSFVESYINQCKKENKRLFMSSSFQTHSIPMLHIISNIDNTIPVIFLDTGFHFPETIVYRNIIQKELELNILTVKSDVAKIDLMRDDGKFLFSCDPDLCCRINKVNTLEKIRRDYDVWITGVRADQNNKRKDLKYIGSTSDGTERFHPMINWTDKMVNAYIHKTKLPSHPLERYGYTSIGCAPCTTKPTHDQRSGRWAGSQKTECGLHSNVIS